MNKVLKKFITCAVVFIAVFSLSQITAAANPNDTTTTIGLDKRDNYEDFEFDMPKDGKVKINAQIWDKGTVPGILTVAIQKEYGEGSPKVKEFTGITVAAPLTDLEVELSEGKYYISYKLSNATGDLKDTSIALKCTAEVLTTTVVNIPELKVSSINSFDELTNKGYNELKFGDGVQESDKNIVVPFTVKNGSGVYITMLSKMSNFDEITGTIYKDKECTKAVGKSFMLDTVDENANYIRTLSGSGTYYIKFTLENDEREAVGETKFLVKLYDLNGADRVISIGKPTLSYQDKAGKKINYKVTVKKKCVLAADVNTATASRSEAVSFRLLDGNKKPITKVSKIAGKINEDNKESMLAVKLYTVTAGTYYIQVTSSSSVYQFEGRILSVARNAGSSKVKAKLLKIDKNLGKGYFTYADKTSKADWYKFNVSSYQYVELYMAYYLDGKFDYEIMNSKGKSIYRYSKNFTGLEGAYYIWYGNYLEKGTYYVKVHKVDNSSSVSYAFSLSNTPHKD